MPIVMVVDDSDADMFFTRRALKKALPEASLHEFHYAEDALSFLRSPERPKFDLLLIDINMPRMSGFEFADMYSELYTELKGTAPLYILSSSMNPDDQAKAEAHPAVSGFVQKPITRQAMETIIS